MAVRKTIKKVAHRNKIRKGIRRKISGTDERPRLSVFRSNNEIYVQVIDDMTGHTLLTASSLDKEVESKGTKTEVAKRVGEELARRAKEKGVEKVVFDRGGYRYHGRVKALATGAREGGLNF